MMTLLTQYTRMRTFEDGSVRLTSQTLENISAKLHEKLLSDIENFEKNDCSGLGNGNCYKMGGW